MPLAQHLRMRLQRDGFMRTLCHGRHWISEKYHERRYGISTLRGVETASFRFAPDHRKYDPAPYRDLKRIFARLPLKRDQNEVLVDYGSGAGRAALVAGMLFPFKSIVGVEIVPSLVKLSKRNLEQFRPKLACDNIAFIEKDATQFDLPPETTVIFFFNPFTGAVLEKVLDKIRQSITMRPRPLTIVFLNPKDAENIIRQKPWMHLMADVPAHANNFHLYRADPADEGISSHLS